LLDIGKALAIAFEMPSLETQSQRVDYSGGTTGARYLTYGDGSDGKFL